MTWNDRRKHTVMKACAIISGKTNCGSEMSSATHHLKADEGARSVSYLVELVAQVDGVEAEDSGEQGQHLAVTERSMVSSLRRCHQLKDRTTH